MENRVRSGARPLPLRLLLTVTVAAFTLSAGGVKAVPPYSIVLYDYLASEPLTDYEVFPAQFPAVESQGAPAVCWPRTSGTRQLRVVFQSPVAAEHDATLTVSSGTFVNVLAESWTLSLQASPTTLHFTPYGTAEATITISGLPNLVELGTLQLPFQLTSEYTGLGGAMGTYTYLTHGPPIGIQRPVWTNVLDDACWWAINQAGPANCSYACTFGLYFSQKFFYTGKPGLPSSWVTEKFRFRLTDFFLEEGWHRGNCVDVSSYLHIANSALGVQSPMVQLRNDAGFVTNPICPIGSDPTGPNYNPIIWTMHQVCRVQGLTYDACLALQLDPQGHNYFNPPAGWTPDNHWQCQAPLYLYGVVKRFVHLPEDQNGIDPNLPGEFVSRTERQFALAGLQ
jgi:hypothetical protein